MVDDDLKQMVQYSSQMYSQVFRPVYMQIYSVLCELHQRQLVQNKLSLATADPVQRVYL